MSQPATPLPWLAGQSITAAREGRQRGSYDRVTVAQRVNRSDDAAYLAHSANAYPKLIEALKTFADMTPDAEGGAWIAKHSAALLRELGEE